jgi:hypothetical protein
MVRNAAKAFRQTGERREGVPADRGNAAKAFRQT